MALRRGQRGGDFAPLRTSAALEEREKVRHAELLSNRENSFQIGKTCAPVRPKVPATPSAATGGTPAPARQRGRRGSRSAPPSPHARRAASAPRSAGARGAGPDPASAPAPPLRAATRGPPRSPTSNSRSSRARGSHGAALLPEVARSRDRRARLRRTAPGSEGIGRDSRRSGGTARPIPDHSTAESRRGKPPRATRRGRRGPYSRDTGPSRSRCRTVAGLPRREVRAQDSARSTPCGTGSPCCPRTGLRIRPETPVPRSTHAGSRECSPRRRATPRSVQFGSRYRAHRSRPSCRTAKSG